MKTKLGLILCAVAVMASRWALAQAVQPNLPRATGHVLVLDNERTIEGDIDRQGDQYRVRRSVGELRVQAESVLFVCESHKEAYRFICSRANLRDPDEHLRLANWCQVHGLKQEALAEVRTALAMRPNHPPSQRLLNSLQRALAVGPAVPEGKSQEATESSPVPPPVNTDSLSLFVTRVQPILMNACANCHATGRGGSFKLIRTYTSGSASRKATLQNLAAVLDQVNPEKPQASLFLSNAVSIHGNMPQPALKNRDIPAYQTLENWVKTTLETNPQFTTKPADTIPSTPLENVTRPADSAKKLEDETRDGVVKPVKPSSKPASEGPPSKLTPAPNEPTPATHAKDLSAEPVDAFDPVIFNRQMHPPQKQEGGKQ